MRLTKTVIDKLSAPSEGQVFYWDEDLKGFGLRVTPTRKTYVAQSRVAGRTVRVTIGTHNPLTPDRARKLARVKLGEMAQGIDHNLLEKKVAASGITLGEAYRDYIASKAFSPNTKRDYERAMRTAFAAWRELPVTGINRRMIEERFDEISVIRKKKRDARGRTVEIVQGKAQANQAFRFLRALLNYAMERYRTPDGEPLIPSNPCNLLTKLKKWHRVERRTRYIEPEKLKLWFSSLDHGEDDTVQRKAVKDLCALLVLTGFREQEGASLLWKDVDLTGRRITIRSTKTHRNHTLPVGKWLAKLLSRRRLEAKVSPYVFPADNESGHLKFHRRDVLALSAVSGVPFRLHDLRRTFASIVNHHLERSLSAYTIKRLLGHASSEDVTAGYIQFGAEDLRTPMQMVEDFVLKAAGKTETAKPKKLPSQARGRRG